MAKDKKTKRLAFVSFIRELLMLIGFCSLEYGLFIVYQPSAYIVGGVLLLYATYPKGINIKKDAG